MCFLLIGCGGLYGDSRFFVQVVLVVFFCKLIFCFKIPRINDVAAFEILESQVKIPKEILQVP